MARSQDNPYLHLLDQKVNQPVEQLNQSQHEPAVLQQEKTFQDLPNFDQMSKLKGEDLKAFEVQQEQEHLAAITLQNIPVDEKP